MLTDDRPDVDLQSRAHTTLKLTFYPCIFSRCNIPNRLNVLEVSDRTVKSRVLSCIRLRIGAVPTLYILVELANPSQNSRNTPNGSPWHLEPPVAPKITEWSTQSCMAYLSRSLPVAQGGCPNEVLCALHLWWPQRSRIRPLLQLLHTIQPPLQGLRLFKFMKSM